ncbi:MAG: vitamin B12 dependent-methionine synthase activation domain-containing protein [candidate division Zixibacteria bacterium]|nr:vitamin B12 dependent-methionine synthase activation domain-containing protein [candidate division Zixibacteria bacterium]MDD5424934.1 vitamin B12 dependent-methionine synthase activation domain-containing protein [candidate division Zixibacteria bacterium]
MDEIIHIDIEKIIPRMDNVLEQQGMAKKTVPSEKIRELYMRVLAIYRQCARPMGIWLEVTPEDFGRLYEGEEMNDRSTPVADIFPRAESLALFAVTLGQAVTDRINELMVVNDFATGSMLDSMASESAESAADYIQSCYFKKMFKAGSYYPDMRVLRYSPGYCGWHISGQKKLFAYLHPETIGLSCNSSFLMSPLKSITGVLIAAIKENHYFEMEYDCCRTCKTFSCRERLKNL